MKKIYALLLILLLATCCLTLVACESKTNISRYVTSKDYFSTTTDNGRGWTIVCFVDTDKFDFTSVDKIVVNVNGKQVTAIIPNKFGTSCDYFEVEYFDSRNRDEKPTIRSIYAYTESDEKQPSDNKSSDLGVTLIVGGVLLLVGAGLHFLSVAARIPFIKYIPGAVFVICTIGAFATSVIDGIVMLVFFAVYWFVCKAITRFFYAD